MRIPYWRKTEGASTTLANLNILTQISPFAFELQAGGTIKNSIKIEEEPWITLVGEAKKNIGEIISTQYDIAMNGYEIGGGGIRLHKAEELKTSFEIMGYDDARIETNFGHMLRALASGTPPHGGIAWGLDRLLTILLNEPNIREVIAFPKTGEGRDLLMQAPSPAPEKTLKELKIAIGK